MSKYIFQKIDLVKYQEHRQAQQQAHPYFQHSYAQAITNQVFEKIQAWLQQGNDISTLPLIKSQLLSE